MQKFMKAHVVLMLGILLTQKQGGFLLQVQVKYTHVLGLPISHALNLWRFRKV